MRCLWNIVCILSFCISGSLLGIPRDFRLEQSEKPFVVLIASYNNEQYAKANLVSVLTQHYSNYRVVFINDCSSDHTLQIVQETIQEYAATDKVTIIDNKERKLGLRNYYEAIVEYTHDEEIIVNLDGDDFLANKNVLWLLNKIYSTEQKDIWLTYGQFVTMLGKCAGWNVRIPQRVIQNNDFRSFPDMPTHLRTFYSWLFKRINKADLLYEGRFFEMTWDYAFMLPMLEMCGGRFMFIDKPLYIYNDSNPINDHKVNKALQDYYAHYIRGLLKYKPLKHDVFHQCQDSECILCNEEIKDKIYESLH